MNDQFDPVQQLRRQMGMLERSCRLYDEGHVDEGVRIAAIIRTLFQDTYRRNDKSKPLTVSVLTHLEHAGYQGLRFLSTCPKFDSSTIFSGSGLSVALIHIQGNHELTVASEPALDRVRPNRWWALRDDWWNQSVYRIGGDNVTRRDLVLTAAEQDGGVHVDSEVDASYARIRAGLWKIGGPDGEPIPGAHLADLRQMGHELLSSRDLARIAA